MSVFYWNCKHDDYVHVYYWYFTTLCNWCCCSFFRIQVINTVLVLFFHGLSLIMYLKFQHCGGVLALAMSTLEPDLETLAKLSFASDG